MILRLPILLKLEENIYTEIELKKPSGGVLADAHEALNKNAFLAMTKFVAGCTVRIISENKEITDKIQIISALNKSSNNNLEYLSKEIMMWHYEGKDKVEGIYYCPRCGTKQIAENIKTEDGIEIDTRDSLKDLKVKYMDTPEELEFEITFPEFVNIGSESNQEQIMSIQMKYPTIENYLKAHATVGENNPVIFQYAVYSNAITKINGEHGNNFYSKGMQIFKNLSEGLNKVLNNIADNINKYGMERRIEKTCNECGKVWQPYINTLNFFDFAPQ